MNIYIRINTDLGDIETKENIDIDQDLLDMKKSIHDKAELISNEILPFIEGMLRLYYAKNHDDS